MSTSHTALTLRGNRVENGISVSNGQVPFRPRWGMTRDNPGPLASTPAPDGNLDKVHVAIADEGVVLVPCGETETPQKELVLVEQYHTGSGRGRWPGFHVGLGPEVRELSSASTGGGSGSEYWLLVSAPLGWAENIASQFVNERDYGDQVISFKPGNTGKKESDVPRDILIAFQGNEDRAHEFMTKVARLDASKLDEHEFSCGRARKKAEVIRVSGDADFFLGADPLSVCGYIAEVHFSQEGEPRQDAGGGSFGSLGDALREAGL